MAMMAKSLWSQTMNLSLTAGMMLTSCRQRISHCFARFAIEVGLNGWVRVVVDPLALKEQIRSGKSNIRVVVWEYCCGCVS